MSLEHDVRQLVVYGEISFANDKTEDPEDFIISFLKGVAETNPDILWSSIFEACSYDEMGLSVTALAAYLGSSSCNNHIPKVRNYLIDLLSTFDPPELLELTEFIKSKVFGIGLGSKSQKILRNSMEKWSVETVKQFSILYPKDLYALCKLLHPRFYGERGEIIKLIMHKIS
jgi:hypothetical protein